MTSLTQHLLSVPTAAVYAAATQHPFLQAAIQGSLSHDRLAFWLSQDRIYAAHAYPRFIGSLISLIPYDRHHPIDSAEEKLNQRILNVLVFCLTNITREVDFFQDIVDQHGLKFEGWKERKGTRDYTAEMSRISHGTSIEDGLVFLWAMEKVYLDAWAGVYNALIARGMSDNVSPTHSVTLLLSKNWSCKPFVDFVETLARLVDDLGISEGSKQWKAAEGIFCRTLELEETFWPVEGEESDGRGP